MHFYGIFNQESTHSQFLRKYPVCISMNKISIESLLIQLLKKEKNSQFWNLHKNMFFCCDVFFSILLSANTYAWFWQIKARKKGYDTPYPFWLKGFEFFFNKLNYDEIEKKIAKASGAGNFCSFFLWILILTSSLWKQNNKKPSVGGSTYWDLEKK